MIQVTRLSALSRTYNTMELPISQEHLEKYDAVGGGLVQHVFPNLNAEQREFLLSGITPQEWNKYIGDFNDG